MPNNFFSEFKQLVSMFLAEIIRSRRVSLKRAADISSEVISLLPKVKSEKDALELLTEVEKDFEEIIVLKQALHFGHSDVDIKIYEHEIKDYAAKIFTKNMDLSANFLKDAAKPEMDMIQLCFKYPDFCEYLRQDPKKSELVGRLQTVSV